LDPYLESADSGVRGLAAWCAGLLRARQTRDALGRLLEDGAGTDLVLEGVPVARRVGDLAREAIALLTSRFPPTAPPRADAVGNLCSRAGI
jgi:hypothetical protein